MSGERQPRTTDWDWWAWRYAADELSDDERRWFEQQLATDSAACQALAQAVELTCAVAAATPQVTAAARSVRVRRAGGWAWASAAIALAAGVLLAVGFWQQGTPRGGPLPDPGEIAAEEEDFSIEDLAIAWWNARASDENARGNDQIARANGGAAAPSGLPLAGIAGPPAALPLVEATDEMPAPDWMISAVRASQDSLADDDSDEPDGDGGEPASETTEG